MINVDGVIYGNFRCDLSGFDLNRCWKNPSKMLHPQIVDIKNEIAKVHRKEKIELYLDFHGHSKDLNIFCYSCKTDPIECKRLPYIFSQMNSMFSFQSCTFGISKDK
jgi:hypothetical protein